MPGNMQVRMNLALSLPSDAATAVWATDVLQRVA